MSQPFIVMGDKTSHGGTVISGDVTCDINGKILARVGDMTVCPRKGCQGVFAIVSGAPDMHSMGQSPARHGDKTACGATLISSQFTTDWSSESSMGDSAAADKADALLRASTIVAPTSSGLCLDCLLNAAASGSSTVVRE